MREITLGKALWEASRCDREMRIYVPHVGGCIKGDWFQDHILNYCQEYSDKKCSVINEDHTEYVVRLVEE